MVPRSELNEIIGGVIARYIERCRVDLYGYVVLSNHYHFVVSGPEGSLPELEENVNREIARRVNAYLRREGHFWGRRYDDEITITPVDALEGLLYVTTNPVKHGLVTHPKQWPGLSCYEQLMRNTEKTYYFTHYTEYSAALRRARFTGEVVRKSDYQTAHTLKLKPIPIFEHLSRHERTEKLRQLIETRTSKLYRDRLDKGLGFIGRKAVLNQPIQGSFPREVSKSPRPICYTKDPVAKGIYKAENQIRKSWYKKASIKFRSGDYNAVFPPYCIKPPLHHVPP